MTAELSDWQMLLEALSQGGVSRKGKRDLMLRKRVVMELLRNIV